MLRQFFAGENGTTCRKERQAVGKRNHAAQLPVSLLTKDAHLDRTFVGAWKSNTVHKAPLFQVFRSIDRPKMTLKNPNGSRPQNIFGLFLKIAARWV